MSLGGIVRKLIAYLVLPPLTLIRKFFAFKVLLIPTDRLGHLSLNTNLFFIRHKRKLIKDINYFLISPSFNSKKIANKEVLLLFIDYSKSAKKVNIICSNLLYFFVSFSLEVFAKNQLFSQLDYKSREDEFSLGEKIVSLSDKQKSLGEETLKEIGIQKSDKIISIFARDNSYLQSYDSSIDWSYHDYRDADIKSYIKTINYLISQGFIVIRIGSEYSPSLDFKNERFFEYTHSKYKSNFMDLFIPYVSEFIIGSRSGATDVSLLFNTPLLVVNSTRFMESPLGKNDLFIQKKIVNSHGEVIPFKELILDSKYFSSDGNELKRLFGIKYINNTENEILEATIEMHQRLEKKFVLNSNQVNLLNKYHREYCVRNSWSDRHAPISINWLENNYDLYFDDTYHTIN
jgi:putative glycosyltransferase (TIGR04372 family)